MLKGINIGGINRLEYINYLINRQDENADMLEKIIRNNEKDIETSSNKMNKDIGNNDNDNNKENNKLDETNNELISNDSNNLEVNENNNFNQKIELHKKYDEESEYIEKEINFYNLN